MPAPGERTFAARTLYDFIGEFSAGVNQGIQPLLLPKNQCADIQNATVRGAFITNRPARNKISLNYGGSNALQTAVEEGIFQDAEYYRPDFGSERLVASISGRQFTFTVSGNSVTVAEVTIPGDPDAGTPTKTWGWQSEKWLIINDGSGKLPIFYDGVVCRRSYGPSQLIATATAAVPTTPPAIGKNVTLTVTLNPSYTGPLTGIPVLFDGANYELVSAGASPEVILTNIGSPSGTTIPSGSNIVVNPSLLGFTAGESHVVGNVYQVGASTAIPGGFGTQLSIDGKIWKIEVNQTGPPTNGLLELLLVSPASVPSGYTIPLGVPIYSPGNIQPSVVVGVTSADFIVPSLNQPITVDVVSPYTGPANQVVWIGEDQFTITAVYGSSGGGTLILKNNSDTSTNPYFSMLITSLPIMTVPELPAGRLGAYGMGRNWFSLTDGISFEAGDIVGGPSGTSAYNFRDAVLKTTENDFLAGGGTFRLPGTGNFITSMVFPANLDVSLGQGALQVGSAAGYFSVNTPVDRSIWESLTNPILTDSMIGSGPLGQDSAVIVNSDVLFRQFNGLGSLVIARRDFFAANIGGNTPISQELVNVFAADNPSLLYFGSAAVFDNRYLVTAGPTVTARGVSHASIVAMNLDPLSNLRTKAPAVYDGQWTGQNILKIVTGFFAGMQRTFEFVYNPASNSIELWEQLLTDAATSDNGNTPIAWSFESPVMFNQDVKPLTDLIRLLDAELYVRDIAGLVQFQVQYRPDFEASWTTWNSFTLDGSKGDYRGPLAMGEPDPAPAQTGNGRPMRVAFFFQFRILVTGSCKIMGMRFSAVSEPLPFFVPPVVSDNPS